MSNVVQKSNTLKWWLLEVKIDIICQQVNLDLWINILVKITFFDVAISLLGHYSKAKIEDILEDLAIRSAIIALFRIGENKDNQNFENFKIS